MVFLYTANIKCHFNMTQIEDYHCVLNMRASPVKLQALCKSLIPQDSVARIPMTSARFPIGLSKGTLLFHIHARYRPN